MTVPRSAADLPVVRKPNEEVLIIIDGQKFMKSPAEALDIAGVICASVAAIVKHGN